MDIGTVLLVAGAGGVIVVALRASGNVTELIGGLFSPPRLGWPSGVQEDDDATWSWAPGARAEGTDDAAARTSGPPTVDRVGPGHPGLRRGH
jgi:hypothetical protein